MPGAVGRWSRSSLLALALVGAGGCSVVVGLNDLTFEGAGGSGGAGSPTSGVMTTSSLSTAAMSTTSISTASVTTAASSGSGNPITLLLGEVPNADADGVTTDTTLDSQNVSANYGGVGRLLAEEMPTQAALIKFELGYVAANFPGWTVTKATVHLWTSTMALDQTDPGNSVHLSQVLENWTEGNMAGTLGVASYDERLAGVSWMGAGAAPPSSTSTTLTSFPAISLGSDYAVPLPPPVVQAWIDAPGQNFGMRITISANGTTDYVAFESSESGNTTHRPSLVIELSP